MYDTTRELAATATPLTGTADALSVVLLAEGWMLS